MVFFRLGPALCPRKTQYFFIRQSIFSPQHRTWSTDQLQLSILGNINLQGPSYHYIYHHIHQSNFLLYVHWVCVCFFDLWTLCLLRGTNWIFTYNSVSFSSLNRPCGYSFPSRRGGPLSIQKQYMRYFFVETVPYRHFSEHFGFSLLARSINCFMLISSPWFTVIRKTYRVQISGEHRQKNTSLCFFHQMAVSWHSSLIANSLEQDAFFFQKLAVPKLIKKLRAFCGIKYSFICSQGAASFLSWIRWV